MPTLFFLVHARLTLLIYNACRTRLRGWSCLADATSPPLTCLGSYTGSLLNKESLTNSCCIFTKLLNDMAPCNCYISAMTHLQNTDPTEYRQRLRSSSSDQTRLIVSRSFKHAGDMSFTFAAARLWNDLPVYLCESQSLPMFKKQLKAHLFPYFFFSVIFILFLM